MTRLTILAATVVVAAASPGTAGAGTFGQHVASCAHELGARPDAPAVTCTHDGMTMEFATFGSMVDHMRTMH